MADGQKFVLEIETLIKLSTGDALAKVRALFNELRAEGRRAIATGSQSGISHLPGLYTANLGLASAFAANKPGVSPAQRAQFDAVARRAEADYRRLQAETGPNQKLRNLTGLDAAHQRGSQLLQEALARQSRAVDAARIAAEQLAAAQRKAAQVIAPNPRQQAAILSALSGGTISQQQAQAAHQAARAAQVAQTRAVQPNAQQQAQLVSALSGGRVSAAQATAASATAEQTRALQIRAATAQLQTVDKAYLEAKAQSTLAERQRSAAVARATRAEATAAGLGGGTFFQRLQAQVHARGGFGGGAGGGGDTRLPSDFQSFGQFFTSKALTTGGFALSGAVLYGVVSNFKEIVREASALQRELAIVKSQFDAIGDSEGFAKFSKRMVDISKQTGVAADEAARVARQLAGVFRIQTEGQPSRPDFNKAAAETEQALKLSQVTGLPVQEITDSLTALTVTFGKSFTEIGDEAIGLEQRLGVLSTELIRFAADVAPVAKTFGLTFEQIIGLGAIAQQRSGVSGGALAENLNRSLPSIQKAQIELARLLAQRPDTQGFTAPILDAIGAGEGAKAIEGLAKAYAKMNITQRQALGDILGGERNAKAFFAILEGGQDTLDVLGGGLGDFGGKLEARFSDFQSTVEFAFQRAGRALEEFGLALFNSGLADGLKLIADSGAQVAEVAAQLLHVFSEFNDVLGGLPVKLLAVYTTLKLISAIGGGIGGVRNLVTGLSTRGAPSAAVASGSLYGFAAPGAPGAGAARLPALFPSFGGQGVAAGGVKGTLSTLTSALAPAIATLAVAQLAQTVSGINQEMTAARGDLSSKVQELIKQGVSQDEVIKRLGSGAFGNATGSLQRDVELKILSFGTADTTSPGDAAIDAIQKANSERQIKELEAIASTLNEKDRKDLERILELFRADPANNDLNTAVARIIEEARQRGGGSAAALAAVAADYEKVATTTATEKAVSDYAPVLAEVEARYAVGDAALAEVLKAERENIRLLKEVLEHASGEGVAKAAQELASGQKDLDNTITTASAKAASISIRIASLRGEDVSSATTQASLIQLRSALAQGASPDVQLEAGFAVLEAQAKELEDFINSPVIEDGIARNATAAEKLARATQGVPVNPGARQAIVRAQVATGANLVAAKALAAQRGQGVDQIIDYVVNLILHGDAAIGDTLKTALESQIANVEHLLAAFPGGQTGAESLITASIQNQLNELRTALGQITPVQDIGSVITGQVSELQDQAAVEGTNEAKALADALIAKQRASAHGDSVAEAQAAVAAARNALRFAAPGSEREAAMAQLIDAQNQLEDAQVAAVQSAVQLAESTTSDPVAKARYALQRAQTAIENAHGVVAKNEALAQQIEAQRTLNDAITDVFRSQQEVVAAIADYAGDTVASAKAQLEIANRNLADLEARAAAGDNSGEAAWNRARAQVVQAMGAVRDAQLRQSSDDIDIALQLERISTQQAIAQFQALLQLPNLTVQQTNELLLKIKQLKDDLGRDYQFNLPEDISPTFYEARRATQGGYGTPPAPINTYTDNHSVIVHFTANNVAEAEQIADHLADQYGRPSQFGMTPKVY